MIPEIGNFALILALLVAIPLSIFPLLGANRQIPGWIAMARPAAQLQALLLIISYAALTYAFVTSDFSVEYVASNSNSHVAPPSTGYPRSGVVDEGSLLLWALILSLWAAMVSLFSRTIPEDMVARVLAVMGMVSAGFLLFMLVTSNPFLRLLPAAAEGRDLNPLLQDFGLALHPPLLYMGYVGFSVAFAFAIAAMLGGKAGCCLDPLVATLDQYCLDVSHLGHCRRQLVGLLRTGLGWLVVLGSGRKCFLHALAGRHRTDPLHGGDRETWPTKILDRTARSVYLLPQSARYLPGSLGSLDLGTCFCLRSKTRYLYSGFSGPGGRRFAVTVRHTCSTDSQQKHLQFLFPRGGAAVK